jgi:hypothetical protein
MFALALDRGTIPKAAEGKPERPVTGRGGCVKSTV